MLANTNGSPKTHSTEINPKGISKNLFDVLCGNLGRRGFLSVRKSLQQFKQWKIYFDL